MRRSIPHRYGFTLVELLVVIGIIAVLISILLPVIGRVRDAAKTTACAANLRSIGQLFASYVAEQRGSYPWGWSYVGETDTGDFTNWASVVSYYANHNRPNGTLGGTGAMQFKDYSPVLKCPAVDGAVYDLATNYQSNPVILVDRFGDRNGFTKADGYPAEPDDSSAGIGTQWTIAPAKASQLFPDNAILWDTPQVSSAYFAKEGADLVARFGGTFPRFGGESFIDDGNLAKPTITSLRYRPTGFDPLASNLNAAGGDPIKIFFDKQFPVGGGVSNTDFPSDVTYNVCLGAARFRHSGETVCNVLFADGSVRGLSWDKRQTKPATRSGGVQNEFLRNFLRIRLPAGVPFR